MEKSERTLLCIDDEPNILNALKRLLRKEDFRMLTAGSGKEGLQILAENEVHVVVSDQRMPETVWLIALTKRLNPAFCAVSATWKRGGYRPGAGTARRWIWT